MNDMINKRVISWRSDVCWMSQYAGRVSISAKVVHFSG